MVLTSVVCCVIENNAYECVSGPRHSLMHSATTITEAVMKLQYRDGKPSVTTQI